MWHLPLAGPCENSEHGEGALLYRTDTSPNKRISWIALFLVMLRRATLFPNWLNTLAALTLVTNTAAGLGFFTLTNPCNAMNGLVVLGGATLCPVLFLGLSVTWLIVRDLPNFLVRLRCRL